MCIFYVLSRESNKTTAVTNELMNIAWLIYLYSTYALPNTHTQTHTHPHQYNIIQQSVHGCSGGSRKVSLSSKMPFYQSKYI